MPYKGQAYICNGIAFKRCLVKNTHFKFREKNQQLNAGLTKNMKMSTTMLRIIYFTIKLTNVIKYLNNNNNNNSNNNNRDNDTKLNI